MENRWVCWDLENNACSIIADQAMDPAGLTPQNDLVVSPIATEPESFEFATIGGDGGLNFWRIDRSYPPGSVERVSQHAPSLPADLVGTHWTCGAYTDVPVVKYDSPILILGAADGSLCAYNPKTLEFVDNGIKRTIRSGA